MPLFSSVFNDPFFDRHLVKRATWWQAVKARLFGIRVYSEDGKPIGWRHNGITYLVEMICDDPR